MHGVLALQNHWVSYQCKADNSLYNCLIPITMHPLFHLLFDTPEQCIHCSKWSIHTLLNVTTSNNEGKMPSYVHPPVCFHHTSCRDMRCAIWILKSEQHFYQNPESYTLLITVLSSAAKQPRSTFTFDFFAMGATSTSSESKSLRNWKALLASRSHYLQLLLRRRRRFLRASYCSVFLSSVAYRHQLR